MKSILQSILIFSTALPLWAAAPAPAKTAAKPLELWVSSFADKTYYDHMVQLYQKKVDPNFTANVEAFGVKDMPDKFAVAIRTGINPPDVLQLDEIMLGLYLKGEVPFIDLSDRMKQSGLSTNLAASRASVFSYQGKAYGVAQSLSAILLWYRTDLFQKYNVNPTNLVTWDDFLKEGERLAASHQAMMAMDSSYLEIILRQRGTDILDEQGNLFPDAAKTEETLNWLRAMKDEGIGEMPERATIFDPVFFSGPATEGSVMCVMGAEWYGLDMIQQFAPEQKGKWAAMPLPAWKNPDGTLSRRTSTWAGQGLLIYKGSKAVDPAWKFIEFVMKDTDSNVERFADGNSFPAYKPSWSDPRMTQPWPFFHDMKLGKLVIDLAPDVPKVVQGPARPLAVFQWRENYFEDFMENGMNTRDLMATMKANLSGDSN